MMYMKKIISLILAMAVAIPVFAEDITIDGYTWSELENMQYQSLDKLLAFPAAEQVFDSSVVADEEEISEALRSLGHPRLIADSDDFARVALLKTVDPYVKQWYSAVEAEGERYMNSSATEYKINGGALSTNADDAALTLAFLSRTCTDRAQAEKYADKCIYYLTAAAQYPDFNPGKMLNVGEIARGTAIAYDWIYDEMTDTEAKEIGTALADNALTPVYGSVYKNRNNWNFVVNGGTLTAAIAFAEFDYDRSASVIREAVLELPDAMRLYYPDGAFIEASGYFTYASDYLATTLASLDTAFGTDWGLGTIKGFEESGYFPIYTKGYTNEQVISYGDTKSTTATGSPLLFWMSEKFGNTDFGLYQRDADSNSLFSILWYNPESYVNAPALERLSGCYVVSGAIPYASFKSDTADKNGIFVGLKGGYNQSSHGDLDIGTFYLGANGKNYTKELLNYGYNPAVGTISGAPSTSKFTRYAYYSHQPQGHNTLVFNPDMSFGQSFSAYSGFSESRTDTNTPYAILDMSGAYCVEAEYAYRGIMLNKADGRVILSDKFSSNGDVWWFMHTDAQITVDGKKAVLDIDCEKLYAEITSGAGSFEIMDAQPMSGTPTVEEYDTAAHSGDKKLAVHLNISGETELQICFSTEQDNSQEFVPMDCWRETYFGKGTVTNTKTKRFTAADDATVNQNTADTPSGADYCFDLRNTGASLYNRYGFMRFEPDTEGAAEKAVLKMYVIRNFGGQADTLSLYSAESGWNEDEITWNNAPALSEDNRIADIEMPCPENSTALLYEVCVDITDYIKSLENMSDIAFGLKLTSRNGAYVQLASKETGRGPVLEIQYTKGSQTVNITDGGDEALAVTRDAADGEYRVQIMEAGEKQQLMPVSHGSSVYVWEYDTLKPLWFYIE